MSKLLLRHGANINLRNNAGRTPLYFCHKYDHRELSIWFQSKGALL